MPQARRRAEIRARLDDRDWLTVELREHQHSFSSIANQLGCSTDDVRSAATTFGLEAPARRVRFPLLADADWLRQQLGARRPLASIATEVGCSESALRAAATRHGIAERRRPSDQRQFPPLHDAAWLHHQYVQAGRSSTEIAAQLGCSPNAVLRALHDHGVPVRSIRRRFPQLHDRAWLRRCYVHEGRRPERDRQRARLSSRHGRQGTPPLTHHAAYPGRGSGSSVTGPGCVDATSAKARPRGRSPPKWAASRQL